MKFKFTDAASWFDLLRVGEFPNQTTGDGQKRYVLQVVTAKDLEELRELWEEMGRPELLIDREHTSHDDKGSTEAMGWLVDLRLTADGQKLQAQGRWSDLGHQLLTGGVLRYCSASVGTTPLPGANGSGATPEEPVRVRMLILRRIALTNLPAVDGLLPISNSLPGGGLPDADKSRPDNQQHNQAKIMELKELAALLGLPETATADEVKAALMSMMEATNAYKKEKETAADETMEEFKNCVPESSRTVLRDLLITNRAATMAVLHGLKKAAAPAKVEGGVPGFRETTVHNRGTGSPARPDGMADDSSAAKMGRGAAQSAAVLEVKNRAGNQAMPYTVAFEIAAAEKPELFATR